MTEHEAGLPCYDTEPHTAHEWAALDENDLLWCEGLPANTPARRELKIHVTVMTDMAESEVRAHANRFATVLAEAVGSRHIKANVTPIGTRR